MLAKTEKMLDSFISMGVPGYDFMVFKDGECIFRKMGGYSNLEEGIPMSGNERYNIYSCSKPITCVAALKLYEDGMFGLDDKLCDYIPEYKEVFLQTENGPRKSDKDILIRHLLNMTAGFSYNLNRKSIIECRNDTNGRCDTLTQIKYMAKDAMIFKAGEAWDYSLCHDVLAAFVEVVSGEKFGEYVRKNIFEPLGMSNSTFLLPEDELDTICEQYIFDDDSKTAKNCGKKIMHYKFGSMYESGGAGAISTAEDYMKFLEALRTGIILKPETVDLMLCDCLGEKLHKYYWYPDYGYGFGVRTPLADRGTTDFGWGGAAGAYWAVDRQNGISMYYAQHMLNSPNQQERYMLYATLKEDLLDSKQKSDFILESKLSQYV